MRRSFAFALPLFLVVLSGCTTLSNGTDPVLPDERYAAETYCEQNSDCVLRDNCCNPCLKDYVNIYHEERIPAEECTTFCVQNCPDPSTFPAPVCRENRCMAP